MFCVICNDDSRGRLCEGCQCIIDMSLRSCVNELLERADKLIVPNNILDEIGERLHAINDWEDLNDN